ncbi:MAG TPA: glycosyltransferase family 39 protein [Opitutaceae bacterium]|nr:glycosyltransferase family 39 protein [Opitutaceae bacterium]
MTGTRNALAAAAAAIILLLHFAMAVLSKRQESTTSDELVHLTGGYTYWKFNDYRLQPENGNLPQRWVALPAWIKGSRFPSLDQLYWRISDSWAMGHEFFYETGEDHFPKLMAARAMTALFSVAAGALVFCWSCGLFGRAGGFVSLLFFAFSPTFLAHGGYATSDVCISLFMLASIGAWWRHLNAPGAGSFALSALVLSLACLAKFSAILLLPMMALCAAVHVALRRGRPGAVLLSAAGHGAVAVAVIWAFYGFRYSAFNPALPAATQFIEAWPEMYARTGGAGRVIHFLADMRALPEAFLYGSAYVVQAAQTRAAFLNGEFSITGWPTFFLWAFALKTTIPFMLASGWSLWLAVRARIRPEAAGSARWEGLIPLTPLFALLLVYGASSISSHLNIGQRHLTPVYPVLFILAGALGRWFERPLRWPALLVAALLGWHMGESAWISPHYLAYFNELAGGPAEGHNHLVDSSLDWGQDLPGLKAWLDGNRRPGEAAYLAYFGTGEPMYYRINAKQLAFINGFHEDEPYIPLGPGLYCVGATMLEQVYGLYRGPWTVELEKDYQFLLRFEPMFQAYSTDPAARARLEKEVAPDKWTTSRDRFQHLRFARLCYCLRARKPDAMIGYSILVYRLTADDVAAATAGTLRDWSALIERSAGGG